MPNPIMRLGTPNRGHQPPDRPQPLTPVPESVHGHNNAYRGLEDHGVASTTPHPDDETFDGTRNAVITLATPQAPVPVEIVQRGGRERLRMQAQQFPLTTKPQRVLSANLRRKSARLKWRATATVTDVMISTSESAAAMSAYPLDVGVTETLDTQAEVWAFAVGPADQVTTVTLYIREDIAESI